MILEVIATTAADAKLAEQGGADRLELITGILEGGLTPSYGLIEQVVQAVSIPVNVMIRPHSQSFCYDGADVRTMISDVKAAKQLGAAGIVIGALNKAGQIDRNTLEALLAEADGLDVTFHRAFDEAVDQLESLQLLRGYPQIRRILTSGGKKSALDAIDRLKQLVDLTRDTHLTIMAGSGLKVDTITPFLQQTGVTEVHFGTGVRVDQQALKPVDPGRVSALIEAMRQEKGEA
ncbi:copper homeostasis protein CutC [Brevibacillus humidisoli]|uniref:copper homeostasis protein CutC n=1 Tax=Brevibacillus humidisoli TaxID=2895522 RepID=UPI001E404840|nr:copper homeostasis protein CutC [Brevibacillus humidisoli]UFJ39568.1 copper homeostasis protein CutC [Brevibacillus humidisoli]